MVRDTAYDIPVEGKYSIKDPSFWNFLCYASNCLTDQICKFSEFGASDRESIVGFGSNRGRGRGFGSRGGLTSM